MSTETSDPPPVQEVPSVTDAATTEPQPTPPPTAPEQPGIVKLNKRRRSWKENLAFLLNLKFFAIILVPIIVAWLIFIPVPTSRPESKGGYFPEKPPKNITANPLRIPTTCAKCYKGMLILLIVAGYWLTDCMPLPGAALFPLIGYPLMKIEPARAFINIYMQDANMMAFATILLALSAWTSGLTKRLAIKILAVTGGNLRRCSFLVVILSALMSMWYPDTAVMMCMMDVVENMVVEIKSSVSKGSLGDELMDQMKAVELKKNPPTETAAKSDNEKEEGLKNQDQDKKTEGENNVPEPNDVGQIDGSGEDESNLMEEIGLIGSRFKIRLLHSVGIIVAIGGLYWPHCSAGAVQLITLRRIKPTDTLNMTNKMTNNMTNNTKTEEEFLTPWLGVVDVGTWMSFTGPVMALLLPLTIWYLDFFNFTYRSMSCSCKKNKKVSPTSEIQRTPSLKLETSETTRDSLEMTYNEKYAALGKLNSHEVGVIMMLVLAEALFMISDPRCKFGWAANLDKDPKLRHKVSSIAMLIAVISFVVPNCGTDMFKVPEEKPTFGALIGWKIVQSNFPWGLLIFIGGGLAIASGTILSRLTDHYETKLLGTLGKSSPYIYLLVLMLLAFVFACSVSNTAAAGILIPISHTVAEFCKIPPQILMVPCVAITALAFITPAGTPALALLHMRTDGRHIGHYLHAGLVLSIIGFIVIYAFGAAWIALHNAGLATVVK